MKRPPVTCMPSPESPANRMTTESRDSRAEAVALVAIVEEASGCHARCQPGQRLAARPPPANVDPMAELPLVLRGRAHGGRTAIGTAERTFTYRDLLDASARVAGCLLGGRDDLAEARVAYLAPPGFDYVALQWGIWRAGGIAIPLAVSHPPAELEYVIRDAEAETVVVHGDFAAVMQGVHLPPGA